MWFDEAPLQNPVLPPLVIGGSAGMLGTNSPLQLNNAVGSDFRLNRYGANAQAATIAAVKSRGVNLGDRAAVAAADQLFALTANGIAGDNNTIAQAAAYVMEVPTAGVGAAFVAGRHVWTTTNLAGVNARRMTLTSEGSLMVGDSLLPGTNFTAGVVFGTNQGVDPAASVDLVHVYGQDRSAGNRQFCVFQEAARVVAAATPSTHKIPVRWNGVNTFLLVSDV